VYEHTYPFLLEQRLKAWRRDIDWQVWNAAVPGYNTSQELAQLLEIGPRFNPDLVVVGFYENDLTGNEPLLQPTRTKRATTAMAAVARRHIWSLEFYRRMYLTVLWRLKMPDTYQRRLQELARADASAEGDVTAREEQGLTPYDVLTDAELSETRCAVRCAGEDVIAEMQRDPTYGQWLASIRSLQALQREGRYHIVFFLNVVPRPSQAGDFFYDGTTKVVNAFLLHTLGETTPAVSCHDAFLHVRPSQMPGAEGHSIGNANLIKADVLFAYLRDHVLAIALRGSHAPLAQ
jgi:hypothetical protein